MNLEQLVDEELDRLYPLVWEADGRVIKPFKQRQHKAYRKAFRLAIAFANEHYTLVGEDEQAADLWWQALKGNE